MTVHCFAIRLAVAVLVLMPTTAFAQASMTGVVRDTSGGVLPGVTVEAASPALIVKVRTTVTTDTGQYRIDNLRPGVYTITFTLGGFVGGTQDQVSSQLTVHGSRGTDLTGSWVSVVSEDWRYRMVTPAKGDVGGVPLNAEGRTVAAAWDPARDAAAGEACRAYGAAGLMRLPGRLRIAWQGPHAEDRDRRRHTDAAAVLCPSTRSGRGRADVAGRVGGGVGRGPGSRRGPLGIAARHHHEPAARLPAHQRRAVQRADGGDRVLRPAPRSA
jgi:hypothetical protein